MLSLRSSKALFEMMAHVSEAFVFIYLGMAVFTYKRHEIQWTNVFCVLIFAILGRIIAVGSLTFCINLFRKPDDRIVNKQLYAAQSWSDGLAQSEFLPFLACRFVMCLSGLRGAVAFALAMSATSHTEVFVTTTRT